MTAAECIAGENGVAELLGDRVVLQHQKEVDVGLEGQGGFRNSESGSFWI